VNLSLPSETVELADAVGRRLAAMAGEPPAARVAALDDMGVLDVVGPESPDPDNGHLDAVVCLEGIGSAGLLGPFAETMWVRSARSELPREGLVALPSSLTSARGLLIPYGAVAPRIGLPQGDLVRAAPAAGASAAHVIVSEGHAWSDVPAGTSSFDQAAPGFAWRSGAALTLGYLEKGLSMATSHARTREQFGRPLESFQAIAFRLAECRWRLTGLRHLVHEAAWRADRAQRQALPVSALAWVYARRVGRVVGAHLHQVHGAIGFSGELGLTDLTGACLLLRATRPADLAVAAAWQERAEIPEQPPSTVYAGFRS